MVYNEFRLLKFLGIFQYLKYRVVNWDTLLRFKIRGATFLIRRKSPDMSVLLSCLSGEFNIIKNIQGFNPSIVLDAGAYIGASTVALAELFPSATIVALEPNSDNFTLLSKNTAHLKNVVLINKALSSESGESALFDRGTGQWGYTIMANQQGKVDVEKISTVTLNELFDLYGDFQLAKIDIEGSEYGLLNDLNDLSKIDVIFIELHERITSGIEVLFDEFNISRLVFRDGGEKYLSIQSKLNH